MATTIGRVVNFGAVDVAATARAACGAATSACGLWPMAFKGSIWQKLYSPAGEACKPTKIAVWADNNEAQQPTCTIGGVAAGEHLWLLRLRHVSNRRTA